VLDGDAPPPGTADLDLEYGRASLPTHHRASPPAAWRTSKGFGARLSLAAAAAKDLAAEFSLSDAAAADQREVEERLQEVAQELGLAARPARGPIAQEYYLLSKYCDNLEEQSRYQVTKIFKKNCLMNCILYIDTSFCVCGWFRSSLLLRALELCHGVDHRRGCDGGVSC
jgi:hypothetical protein